MDETDSMFALMLQAEHYKARAESAQEDAENTHRLGMQGLRLLNEVTDKVDAAKALHQPERVGQHQPLQVCRECVDLWPCATYRALTD